MECNTKDEQTLTNIGFASTEGSTLQIEWELFREVQNYFLAYNINILNNNNIDKNNENGGN